MFRAGRLWETFWNSQSNIKYTMVFIYPGLLYYVRWRAETKYKYRVYIADKKVQPDDSENLIHMVSDWKNGSVFYYPETATVQDVKNDVYGSEEKIPPAVRVGCYGRMMENSDNLALAVRTFCKRDPMLVFWEEEADK